MLQLVRGGALGIAAVWTGRGLFLAGHVSFVEVGLRIGADAEVVAGHLAAEIGRGEVHCLLGLFEIFLDEPDVFLSGTIRARSWSVGHVVLAASEDRHGEEGVVHHRNILT